MYLRGLCFVVILEIVGAFEPDKIILDWHSNVGCDFEILPDWPRVYPNKPFVVKNTSLNREFRNRMNLSSILNLYGERTVGVDYPGTRSPPTRSWKSMKFKEFVKTYVNHNKGPTEIVKSSDKNFYLWGLTDHCETFNMENCKEHNFTLLPQEVVESFQCFEKNVSKYIGINGPYKGINYHSHPHVSNEVVFGSRMWIIRRPKSKIEHNGATASSTVFRMITAPSERDNTANTYFCKTGPGDVIYIPNYWLHMTYNLEPTMTIACNLNHN